MIFQELVTFQILKSFSKARSFQEHQNLQKVDILFFSKNTEFSKRDTFTNSFFSVDPIHSQKHITLI